MGMRSWQKGLQSYWLRRKLDEMRFPDIIEICLRVVRVFEKFGIPYHIAGSLASSAFGIARATLDVDIVADIKYEQALKLAELLGGEFYVDSDMILEAIQKQSSFNLIHLETLFKVDVFPLKNRLFDHQIFSRRSLKTVSEEPPQQLYFPTSEDIILNKLEWYKAGGEISERQWNDILGVLKVQGSQLAMDYLTQWAKELSISDLLKKAIDEAGIF
jgi:hypothetical protein